MELGSDSHNYILLCILDLGNLDDNIRRLRLKIKYRGFIIVDDLTPNYISFLEPYGARSFIPYQSFKYETERQKKAKIRKCKDKIDTILLNRQNTGF